MAVLGRPWWHLYRHRGAQARRVGFTQVSLSYEVSPLIKLVGRGDTAGVHAYLSPILRRHVDEVVAALGTDQRGGTRLMFMQSNGGLTYARMFHGRDAILSGPAAYRRDGPLTVTDCNVLLGKLRPEHFPHLFGPDGNQVLRAGVVRQKFTASPSISAATSRSRHWAKGSCASRSKTWPTRSSRSACSAAMT